MAEGVAARRGGKSEPRECVHTLPSCTYIRSLNIRLNIPDSHTWLAPTQGSPGRGANHILSRVQYSCQCRGGLLRGANHREDDSDFRGEGGWEWSSSSTLHSFSSASSSATVPDAGPQNTAQPCTRRVPTALPTTTLPVACPPPRCRPHSPARTPPPRRPPSTPFPPPPLHAADHSYASHMDNAADVDAPLFMYPPGNRTREGRRCPSYCMGVREESSEGGARGGTSGSGSGAANGTRKESTSEMKMKNRENRR